MLFVLCVEPWCPSALVSVLFNKSTFCALTLVLSIEWQVFNGCWLTPVSVHEGVGHESPDLPPAVRVVGQLRAQRLNHRFPIRIFSDCNCRMFFMFFVSFQIHFYPNIRFFPTSNATAGFEPKSVRGVAPNWDL